MHYATQFISKIIYNSGASRGPQTAVRDMAAGNCAKSVQSFLGPEAYNQLLKTVGKDEISEVNEKLSSRIEEHSQLNETLTALRDENRNLRRGHKTSKRALRKTKEKEEYLMQAYMRQTDEKFKSMDDLQILMEESVLRLEKALESTMKDATSSHERLLRAEKGKVKAEHKKQRHELESTQKKIRTVIKLVEQEGGEEPKREHEKQALVDIFLEQTKNLEDQHKLETQGMDRVFQRLEKERGQEYKTFSKAILHMKLKYQIIAKENFIHQENISEPTRTTEGKTDVEKERATTPDMIKNKNQDREEIMHVENTPQACVDETNEKQKNKEKDKHSSKGRSGKARPAPGAPPPTPSFSPSASRSTSPPTLPPRREHPRDPPSLPPRPPLPSTTSIKHSSEDNLPMWGSTA